MTHKKIRLDAAGVLLSLLLFNDRKETAALLVSSAK